MEEQLITFETAKLAKEKGFEWKCQHGISEIDNEIYHANYGVVNWNERPIKNDALISAPTQSLLQKWLREVQGIDIIVLLANTSTHCYIAEIWQTIKNKPVHSINLSDSKTYEEALEKGLQEALKLIKS